MCVYNFYKWCNFKIYMLEYEFIYLMFILFLLKCCFFFKYREVFFNVFLLLLLKIWREVNIDVIKSLFWFDKVYFFDV